MIRSAFVALVIVASMANAGAAADGRVTYSDQVAPILVKYCVGCHQSEGPAPFSLAAYAPARAHASQIAAATGSHFMPPWKADPASGPFVGQEWPTADEIDLLRRWSDDGAPEGTVPVSNPPPPRLAGGWRLGQPDLVVTIPEPFLLPADGVDLFRVFVIHLPGEVGRYVRGLEFQPGNARVVHHANIRLDRTSASRDFDAADPAPGYDGLLARSALFPDGHFLGWTPGQVAPLLPKGLAWRLEPGSDLVLQLHLQPSGKPELIQPSVAFYFGSDPPARTPVMLRLGRQDIDIPPEESHYVVTDRYTLPVDVEVQAIQPHAHYRARDITGTATLPDGTTRSLIRIANWDFRWQHLYRYVTPLALPKGTVLSMRYSYDNSSANPGNPQQPPARARWGQRSAEEMGDLWIQVLTRDDRDRLVLNRDFRPKAVAEDLIGYEGLIGRDPANAALHDDAAMLCLELGESSRAADHFEASARLKPDSASAHFNLGTVLMLGKRYEEAAGQIRSALRLTPRYANAYNNLGNAAEAQGRLEEARQEYIRALVAQPQHAQAQNNLGGVLLKLGQPEQSISYLEAAIAQQPDYANAHNNLGTARAALGDAVSAIASYRRAIAIDPAQLQAQNNLGRLLADAGNLEEATGHLDAALRFDPDYAEAHYNLAIVKRLQRDVNGAVDHLGVAVRLRPDWLAAVIDLAWTLATAPDQWSDGARAVPLAERAVALSGGADPAALDVLGAALARHGDFDRAIDVATHALAAGAGGPLASEIRTRIALYRQRIPYRSPFVRAPTTIIPQH